MMNVIHSPSVSLLDELQHWGHVETPPSVSSSSAASLHARLRTMAIFSLQNFRFISHTLPVIYFVRHCEEFTSFQKIFPLWLLRLLSSSPLVGLLYSYPLFALRCLWRRVFFSRHGRMMVGVSVCVVAMAEALKGDSG